MGIFPSIKQESFSGKHLLLMAGLAVWGLFSVEAIGQNVKSLRLVNEGHRAFDQNQFFQAITHYEQALEMGGLDESSKRETAVRLADAYRLTHQFEKCQAWCRKMLEERFMGPGALLKYGVALKQSAQYEEAKKQFRRYLRIKKNDPRASMLLASCDSAEAWLAKGPQAEVEELRSLNTQAREFSPVPYRDGLMFASDRTGVKEGYRAEAREDYRRLDLLYSPFDEVSQSFEQKYIVSGINTPSHEAVACLSADRQEIFFTRTVEATEAPAQQDTTDRPGFLSASLEGWRQLGEEEAAEQRVEHLRIFYAQRKADSTWGKPTDKLPFNGSSSSTGHPALSPDGQTLVFMSDRQGGQGETDLYFAQRDSSGEWTQARNLGPSINTFGKELFPAFGPGGALYFSTDGRPGLGGLDIFRTRYDSAEGRWQAPVNLRYPINSSFDDFGIALLTDGYPLKGYLSSMRLNSTGREDIFSFIESDVTLRLDGDVLRMPANRFFNGLRYELYETTGDGKRKVAVSPEDEPLRHSLQGGKSYLLEVRKEGFPIDQIQLTYEGGNNGRLKSLEIDPGQRPVQVVGFYKEYIAQRTPASDMIEYSPDSFRALARQAVGLLRGRQLLRRDTTNGAGRFRMAIDTQGVYTITTDSALLNQPMLSPKAKYVFRGRLVSLGSENPVSGGDLRLVLEGDTLAGTSDAQGRYQLAWYGRATEAVFQARAVGHYDTLQRVALQAQDTLYQDLRLRPKAPVEIAGRVTPTLMPEQTQIDLFQGDSIIDRVRPDAQGRYTLTGFADSRLEVVANKPGYLTGQRAVSTQRSSLEGIDINLTEKATTNRVVPLDQVLWDYDSYRLRNDALPVLKKLVGFLESNPKRAIEIRSHTDARGGPLYNQYLSEKRAETVVRYLVSQGIDRRRLIARGYGESKPEIPNAQTEAQHQRNRRTEFKILEY
jgi:outer membrane protein OmpA-like peptidoglycan-associated protein/tetratricopeptide (TPR) repeat protein